MSKKVYLSPSSQNENKYSYGDYTEAQVCRRIAEACSEALTRSGVTHKIATTGYDVANRVKEANNYDADYIVPIHTNAGGGDGSLMMCYPGYKNDAVVQAIYKYVSRETPGKDDGIREVTNLSEIVNTYGITAYIECEFHDNADLAKWIVNNIRTLGEAIAKGICEGIGVKYVEPYENETGENTLYKVQCGAFSKYGNAERLKEVLDGAGFDTYIVPDDGLYKVQIGAFSSKENAEKLAEKAKNSGYDVCIIK